MAKMQAVVAPAQETTDREGKKVRERECQIYWVGLRYRYFSYLILKK